MGSDDQPTPLDRAVGGLDSPANFLRRMRLILILIAIIGVIAAIKALT
jgi:hypothetical protein